MKWYWEAARQGDAAAYYRLGRAFHLGDGVDKDLVEALRWYLRAAKDARGRLQAAARHRSDTIVAILSNEQVAVARRRAHRGGRKSPNRRLYAVIQLEGAALTLLGLAPRSNSETLQLQPRAVASGMLDNTINQARQVFVDDGAAVLRDIVSPVGAIGWSLPSSAISNKRVRTITAIRSTARVADFTATSAPPEHDPAFHAFCTRSPLPEIAAALLGRSQVNLFYDSCS